MESHSTDDIPCLVRRLYETVRELEELFPGKHFTPDGHLVGSLGEVLAEYRYDLEPLAVGAKLHDARACDGRLIQIKATQRDRIGLRGCPDHLLVLRILSDGRDEEMYNGPGKLAWCCSGRRQSNGQRQISTAKLVKLMEQVSEDARLPVRNPPEAHSH